MCYLGLQKIDAIVDVRKKVLSTYSVVEDRLTAVNILVNHWHNRRKTNQKECKDQSLEGLTPGKQILYVCSCLPFHVSYTDLW